MNHKGGQEWKTANVFSKHRLLIYIIITGHGYQEAVSVSVLMGTVGFSPVVLTQVLTCVTDRENLSCKLSHILVDHPQCVTATSHQLLLDKFGLRMKDLQSLDNDLMMAAAYEKLSWTWNILGKCPEGGRVVFEVGKLLVVVWCTAQSRVISLFCPVSLLLCFVLWLICKIVELGGLIRDLVCAQRDKKDNNGYCNCLPIMFFCLDSLWMQFFICK